MRSLTPSLQRAWDDMNGALVRRENVPLVSAGFNLPRSAPFAVLRPLTAPMTGKSRLGSKARRGRM
jgi:hypothetical protein